MTHEAVASDASALELWGGTECTVVRVGDDYRDQSEETGHAHRRGDIDLIADLGIRTVRYPILWENVAPDSPEKLDFAWHDDRLAMLRERGVRVIGGLLHHGSGPRYTNLLDPDFAAKLSDYASHVAGRYPWIEDWTPVNEPLTTARFSGLYGHWYPHGRDYGTFLRALGNECLGTLGAMRVIRRAIPGARLVQTEDLGKTFSTAPLRYQARHDNQRRWLSFDLLCGRVDPRHEFWGWLLHSGLTEADLDLLRTGEARPDLIGINHYLTSDRFLDHRTEMYPWLEPGNNGRDAYIDAEAVRVKRLDPAVGFSARLRETWARYKIPLAITEVHHGCTRDEQLRWFVEVWNEAQALRAEGIDLRAVTAWSMFGNVDWRSLLTRRDGVYDTGIFDVRGPEPRPTVIARAARAFAAGTSFDHPVLDAPGWWRRPERLYPWNGRCKALAEGGRKLLIAGAGTALGDGFARIAEHRGLPYCVTDGDKLDVTDEASIRAAIDRHRPWAIIDTVGRGVADTVSSARRKSSNGLANICAELDLPLVSFSSDLPAPEARKPRLADVGSLQPTNIYGLSKTGAQEEAAALGRRALVIRTGAFFGPWDRFNCARVMLDSLARGEPVRADRDTSASPAYIPDLCHATLDLLIDGETGVWHLANQGRLSWYEFAREIAIGAGYDSGMVLSVRGPVPQPVPAGRRGLMLRPIEHAIGAFLDDSGERGSAPPIDIAAE